MGERRTTDRNRPPRPVKPTAPSGVTARSVALEALRRIDEGAYANLVVPALLSRGADGVRRAPLETRDRNFVTEIVYGVTRMRRALDFVLARYLHHPPAPEVHRVLRMGAYQLLEMRVASHAAVDSSVSLAPKSARGLVNAVLRRVSEFAPIAWPSDAVRLSYPDWIVSTLVGDLGESVALETLQHMNRAPNVTTRADGYVQDAASQWVAQAVDAQADDTVLDMCAAPGGKATAIADTGALVVATDVRAHRGGLVGENVAKLGLTNVPVVVADGLSAPFRSHVFDRVLVDAPCSGLGVLHRRPDARWNRGENSVAELVQIQQSLLTAAFALIRPGGVLVYSVCTLTNAETVGIDEWLGATYPQLIPIEPLTSPWKPLGRGAMLLPQWANTDGMALFRYRVPHLLS
jgi:16S rRNA (cytosine967-C5)-methyltransferase